jgi:soluble lytic murein transglycosylase-like protein
MYLGAVVSSTWFDSGCGSGPRARWLEGGAIEIEGEGAVKKALPAAVKQWSAEISAAAVKFDLWPNFIAGFVATESGGQQKAHSYCCYGLMGLLPATASSMAGREVGSAELLDNPALNIELGSKYIDQLMTKYKDNPIKAAAGYNAGSAKCGAGKCSVPNRFNLVADCVDGKAVDYVTRIISYSNAARGDLPVVIPKSPGGGASPLLIAGGIALAVGGAFYLSRGARA